MATFSPGVLALLWKYNRKLPVIHPSKEFVESMIETNNLDKILDLRIQANQHKASLNYSSTNSFNHLTFTDIDFIDTLTSLTVFYHEKIDLLQCSEILVRSPSSIKHFSIHCDAIKCVYCSLKILDIPVTQINQTIETFALHLNDRSQSPAEICCPEFVKCLLTIILHFIKSYMANIRHIRIFQNGSIQMLLDPLEWTELINKCPRLDTIKLRGKDETFLEMNSHENVQRVREVLCSIRETINFNVQVT